VEFRSNLNGEDVPISITSICCGFAVPQVLQLAACYATNPPQIEVSGVLSAVVTVAVGVVVAGFRNLFRCGHGQLDHSVIYGGPTNVHVLTVAAGAGAAEVGQQICRSASSRSFTFSTKV